MRKIKSRHEDARQNFVDISVAFFDGKVTCFSVVIHAYCLDYLNKKTFAMCNFSIKESSILFIGMLNLNYKKNFL